MLYHTFSYFKVSWFSFGLRAGRSNITNFKPKKQNGRIIILSSSLCFVCIDLHRNDRNKEPKMSTCSAVFSWGFIGSVVFDTIPHSKLTLLSFLWFCFPSFSSYMHAVSSSSSHLNVAVSQGCVLGHPHLTYSFIASSPELALPS